MVRKENIHGDIIYRNEQGEFHRENGPAIKYSDGGKAWFINGKRHRVGGPAEDYLEVKAWWKNGKRHRLNAPASLNDLLSIKEYWEFGKFIR